MSTLELKAAIIAAFPPGASERIDWEGPPGQHMEAMASVIKDKAVDPVEQLILDACPLTCGSARLRDWERSLGLASSKTALFGTLEARRRPVISRLREYGPPTIPMIQSVLAPLFDYSDPADVVVLECDRPTLRTAHTYTGVLTSASTAISCVYTFRVFDDGRLSASGVQLDVTLTHGDLSKLSCLVTAPSGETATASVFGRGAASGDTVRVCLPDMTATSVMGKWTVQINAASGTGTVDALEAFVEGAGRDSSGRPGLSAAQFELGVVYEADKSNGGADLAAARAALARISYATRIGALILREAGGVLPDGEYAFLPGDDNALPGAIIPGS